MRIDPCAGSDSREPTILYEIGFSVSRLNSFTVDPNTTLPVCGNSLTSIMVAFESVLSISLIFASIRPCCSLAA